MEAVVSRVSATPEEASELIQEEQKRQDTEKKKRDFGRTTLVSELTDFFNINFEDVEELYRKSKSIDQIAKGTALLLGDPEDSILDYWRSKEEQMRILVNEARSALSLEPLDFESKPKPRSKKAP